MRVLKASDVLDPEQSPTPDMHERDSGCCVEELLPLLSKHKEGIVAMQDGAQLGVVTANSVIAALAHEDHAGVLDPTELEEAAS